MKPPATLGLDVSRETKHRLEIYIDLLTRWNKKINLVSPNTLPEVWTRHVLDSAQLLSLSRQTSGSWVDLGSGGGFPGMVVAILTAEEKPDIQVTMVESDQRKSAFLRTVARETGLTIHVKSERIENTKLPPATIVSARALAPLNTLLGFVEQHIAPDGKALLPKGAQWEEEVATAKESWSFTSKVHKSKTNQDAVILEIGEISHV
ncbi:16S rRNA (guanine(527)-N(7))-methyltransferase RsmG [Pacificoceanicola onchidii]|uniref:16S rRNA (guanine(527)-N(7))-methyltransferase RsmG n=1 Tax=Pacificoceanicola onchidii TaxID=2562685 RepID=UPI0010A5B388|nr:16S rRNA (guanine(527)-N(7))-methyltransferase RsmG [Pacificoceanicola onchidii]